MKNSSSSGIGFLQRFYLFSLIVAIPFCAQAESYRGDLNGWGTAWMTQDSNFGSIWNVTLTNNWGTGSSTFKYDQDGDWDPQWGSGTDSQNATANASLGQVRCSCSGEGVGNMTVGVTTGKVYTFRLNGTASWWDRQFMVMETDAWPVDLLTVSDDAITAGTGDVTVAVTLNTAKSSQETIYVRYTTNEWTSASVVSASGSSTNYSATIPGQPSGTPVEYYALSSTMPGSLVGSQTDLSTLRGNSDGGTNYSYRVGGGNSWHYPTNAEPTGAFMRNPPTNGVPTSQAVYFYNGTYTNDSDQSGGTLYHRLVGGGSWTATNLAFDSNNGAGNQYWKTQIPADTYGTTNEVEYYFSITYNNEDTTYLGSTNGSDMVKYLAETNAQANTYTFSYGGTVANLGNCWHIPTNVEPYTVTMRNPVSEPATNQSVYIYNGNQFQGAGNSGDQSGGWLFYRLVGAGSWSSNALSYDNVEGNNKYWKGTIDAGTFGTTNEVEYFLLVEYNDHDDTYIGTTDNGVSSQTYAEFSVAETNTFSFTYSDAEGSSAAWMWHADNRVVSGSNVQFWVKIGYAEGLGSNRWVDNAALYYTIDGSEPQGAYGAGTNGTTQAQSMIFDHVEEDDYAGGNSMWWAGTVTNLPMLTSIRYRIGSWKTTNDTERFADYNTSGTNDNVFAFSIGTAGAMALTVNGVNADYTTTKFFLDEISGDTGEVVVRFTPGVPDLDKVEIFSNLGRRDYVDVDYESAMISTDGVPDGIRPPDGNLITTNDTGAYFTAWPMTHVGGGEYVWTGTVDKCGAYRLTARYSTNDQAANTWHWYTDTAAGRRDHAIVASPTKVHEMTMYELNTLTVEATYNDKDHRSTFVDLLGAAQGDTDGFDPFNLEYLNYIQANCLWFQPIHPSADTSRGDPENYTPGSPYATRDYFAVSKYFGADETEEGAMTEFTNFVAECDSYTGSVGTINIMLDGVFNHTAWDAEMGQGGLDLGFCTNKDDRIGWFKPGWYALWTDYGAPATYYHTVYSNDFATAPDRGDFGKWDDVAELYFGNYDALVQHNPDDNSAYLDEGDWYDYSTNSMTDDVIDLWKYFAYYAEYWLEKTGHAGTNSFVRAEDDKGIDGLRCDFGQGLPPQCWEYIINRTRSKKWNFVFMAETLDGGKPGYRSNRHFDVLNENLVFQFTQSQINDSWALRQALEDRRNAYSGGTILLNLTSHDEVLPDSDAWLVASRYGAVSTVDGIPMIFYGQEQGIQNYASTPADWYYDGFRTDHEENFGKFIPNFKQWNQLTVWSNPPPNNGGLDQWYGRVNWARLNSPALQSPNRYFLSTTDGDENARILAVAKYENGYATPRTSDVVLAFANMLRHGESHTPAADTYNLQGAWDVLGLDTGKQYNVRNLAASDASAYVWGSAKSGSELYNDGLYVSLGAGTVNSITNDGELVQYLKIEEINQAPQISLPGPHILPVGSGTNFPVTASDADGDSPTLNNTVGPIGSVFAAGVFAWTATVSDVNTTNLVVFVANDQRNETNSIVTNNTVIVVPYDSDGDSVSDSWEWDNFTTLANDGTDDSDSDGADNYHEFVAQTDPNATGSLFRIQSIVDAAGKTNFDINVATEPGRKYVIQYTDANLSNTVTWTDFADTNYGVWIENRSGSTNFTFTDTFEATTTGGEPADGYRVYRIKVGSP
jgi:hypothetical protein